MAKSYGSQSKEDLLQEIAILREQIDFYEFNGGQAQNRSLALNYAIDLTPPVPEKNANDVVAEALIFADYLNGKPDDPPITDPDVPVPSPS